MSEIAVLRAGAICCTHHMPVHPAQISQQTFTRTGSGDQKMARFSVNGVAHDLDIEADMPLLWALRDELGLTGTKFGCGIAACGACTVQVNGNPVRSCVLPVSAIEGAEITTIEGLATNAAPTPVQQAWIEHQVPQCGYCQSGMIMAVSALLTSNPAPSEEQIDGAISNICRCGTYPRIRQAIQSLVSSTTAHGYS